MPFKRRGVVPFEAGDTIPAARVGLERLGRAERTDRRRDIVVPRAGVGVVFFIREGVIVPHPQAGLGAEQRDTVDLAPRGGHMFLEPPTQSAKEIKLPFLGVVVRRAVRPRQRVIAGPVQKGVVQRYRVLHKDQRHR